MSKTLRLFVAAGLFAALPVFGSCGGETTADSTGSPQTPAAQPAKAPDGAPAKTPAKKPDGAPVADASAQATWIVYTLPG